VNEASQKTRQRVLDELPFGIWVARAPTGDVLYTNQSFRTIIGMDAVSGGDISKGIEEWSVDTTRTVRVHVTKDEYGTKLKSIFSNDRQGGFLIKKMALDEGEKAEAVIGYNERIAALRALRAQNSGQPTPAPASNGTKPVVKSTETLAAPKSKVSF